MKSSPGKKWPRTKIKITKYNCQQKKQINNDEPHMVPNEETEPI